MFEQQVARLMRTDWSKLSPNMMAEELSLLLSALSDLVTSGRMVVNYVPKTEDDSAVEFSSCGDVGKAVRYRLNASADKTIYDAAKIVDCADGQTPPLGALTGQIIGKTSASVLQNASGIINVYEGMPGSEKDSGQTISAWSPFGAVDANKWVECTHNGYGWYITAAQC